MSDVLKRLRGEFDVLGITGNNHRPQPQPAASPPVEVRIEGGAPPAALVDTRGRRMTELCLHAADMLNEGVQGLEGAIQSFRQAEELLREMAAVWQPPETEEIELVAEPPPAVETAPPVPEAPPTPPGEIVYDVVQKGSMGSAIVAVPPAVPLPGDEDKDKP